MKISCFAIPQITLGKHNVKDSRLDEVDKITKAKKKTYIQVELLGAESALDADAILVLKDNLADLVLKDLELVETRLGRTDQEAEKAVLLKIKQALENEQLIANLGLSPQEKGLISAYGFFTNKPAIAVNSGELEDLNALLVRAVKEAGYISFFTTGEKETRAWLIKNGATAWEASGAIHSDIQKGFIRAEIISFNDFIACGGETGAKQAGKMRLEQKDYLMQDTDLANFRFNK